MAHWQSRMSAKSVWAITSARGPAGFAGKARPRVDGHLVERRLQIVADGDAMVRVQGQRVLDQDADEAARERGRIDRRERAREQGHAADLVAVDARAEVEARARPRAVDQEQRAACTREPVGQLDRAGGRGAGPCPGERRRRRRASGSAITRRRRGSRGPRRGARRRRRAAPRASMDSSGPPMPRTRGPVDHGGDAGAAEEAAVGVARAARRARLLEPRSSRALASTSRTRRSPGERDVGLALVEHVDCAVPAKAARAPAQGCAGRRRSGSPAAGGSRRRPRSAPESGSPALLRGWSPR